MPSAAFKAAMIVFTHTNSQPTAADFFDQLPILNSQPQPRINKQQKKFRGLVLRPPRLEASTIQTPAD
jgi:hypothetical protein